MDFFCSKFDKYWLLLGVVVVAVVGRNVAAVNVLLLLVSIDADTDTNEDGDIGGTTDIIISCCSCRCAGNSSSKIFLLYYSSV